MQIELKRISHNERLSEETFAFSADLYIDGAKAGDVRNSGHGGCHMFSDRAAEERLNAYARTLAPIDVSGMYRDGEKHTMPQDAESIVNDLVSAYLVERDLKKALSKRILYTKQGETAIYQTKAMAADVRARILAHPAKMAEAWKAEKVLNLIPFDEALRLYRTAA